jgi:tetratricopeptide (TPR) repeat protein
VKVWTSCSIQGNFFFQGSGLVSMSEIRAFVGHSFLSQDEKLVRTFTDYFDTLKRGALDFDWTHATEARPEEVSTKVLELIDGKNLFIGICTKNERATKDGKLSKPVLGRRLALEADLEWKTSDWIIQEIGLAIGRKMTCCLLVERGVRKPGGLQGNLEYIEFERSNPEKSFPKILEMLSALKKSELQGGVALGAEASSAANDDSQAPESDGLLKEPDQDWDEEKFRQQFTFAIILKDPLHANKVSEAFKRSPFSKGQEALSEWAAFCETQLIRWGEGGNLEKLKALAKDHDSNVNILASVARGYAFFGDVRNAEELFRRAVDLSDNSDLKIRLLGELAELLQQNGLDKKVAVVADELRSLTNDPETELKVVTRLADLPAWYKDNLLKAALYERRLEIEPADTSARFQLAYLHSQIGNEALAMYHYERIPQSLRDGTTWNNLGAVYQHFSLPARSVAAYRNAIEKSETIAMANVAYIFMGAGFLKEAREMVDVAQKEPNYHKNVVSALSRLNEIPDDEEKQHSSKLEGISRKSNILARIGGLLARPLPAVLPVSMRDDKCDLTIEVDGDEFKALGSYREEKSQKSANSLFGSTASAEEHFEVAYRGRIVGEVVVGERTIARTGTALPISLFGLYPITAQFVLPLPGVSGNLECLMAGEPQTVRIWYESN